MMPPKHISNLLIPAFLLETLCVTYALYLPAAAGWLSVLHTCCGLVIAVALLWTKPVTSVPGIHHFSLSSTLNRYRWLLMGIVLMVMIYFFRQLKAEIPLDYRDADMLPIIKIMCQRFLSGAWGHVYDPIHEIWGGTHPIYLPAMWLPFVVPQWLHIDIRWLTVLLFFLVFCLFIWKINPARKNALPIMAGAFLLFWWLFADSRSGLIPYTEEAVVIFFYVLLVMALHRQNAWLIGFAVSLCVLSRYALIGWIPALLWYFIYRKDWKSLVRIVAAGMISFVGLVLLPFGWEIIKSLIALPVAYIDFTRRVWHDSPHHFLQNLGWAKFFGAQRIVQMHYLLVTLSFTVPLVCMIIGLELNKRFSIPVQNLPFVILKITLVIFYSFIDVPYLYLFYTSSFVSLMGVVYFVMQERGRQVHTA